MTERYREREGERETERERGLLDTGLRNIVPKYTFLFSKRFSNAISNKLVIFKVRYFEILGLFENYIEPVWH